MKFPMFFIDFQFLFLCLSGNILKLVVFIFVIMDYAKN